MYTLILRNKCQSKNRNTQKTQSKIYFRVRFPSNPTNDLINDIKANWVNLLYHILRYFPIGEWAQERFTRY